MARARGRIELICGPMFSGKSTALIARANQARAVGQNVIVFKPALDNRYSENEVVSHDGVSIRATPIAAAREMLGRAIAVHLVAIDEIHFFDGSTVDTCMNLADRGIRVVAAGVELDHRGRPFETTAHMAAAADDVIRLTARCARCGEPARHSQRLVSGATRIIVGGPGAYEPRCDRCFEPGKS